MAVNVFQDISCSLAGGNQGMINIIIITIIIIINFPLIHTEKLDVEIVTDNTVQCT
jgi:hypothetical protein